MKHPRLFGTIVMLMAFTAGLRAQHINDSNTPLHLMKPEYKLEYGVPTVMKVEQTIKLLPESLRM